MNYRPGVGSDPPLQTDSVTGLKPSASYVVTRAGKVFDSVTNFSPALYFADKIFDRALINARYLIIGPKVDGCSPGILSASFGWATVIFVFAK